MLAQQVMFDDGEEVKGGILVNSEFIICGCCGGVFEAEEVEVIEYFEYWVPIGEEI